MGIAAARCRGCRLGSADGLLGRRAPAGMAVGALTRPDMPSRCTLPITALRVTPPASSAAMRLALRPSIQSLRRSSTRSSVQDITPSLPMLPSAMVWSACLGPWSFRAEAPASVCRRTAASRDHRPRRTQARLKLRPSHEMSWPTGGKLH